ncbi:hypothetical protein [Klenkia taihuensis]|uniref:DUF308 domain-containing protein n=1 Tax=Klenkia taihuensis TaxID=1225127 RepID=A0A1I1T143_9ACTN|nr:hypothetical protein [Klenkia taihuensis]GHE13209.1 hypothetical protein GCM10011381_34350 [Klenkia taihuensis]SFD49913.1 hypothetical protein SAMN05661030_3536 [Klenkia taihuensis]
MSASRGRRDNGLDAPLWHPLRDVDPRVGEHLLDVLREEGIAAYLAPSTDTGPYTRTQFLPSPPTDRLFVDRARRADARTLVDTHADEHPAAEPTPRRRRTDRAEDAAATDAEFARIVAAWEAEEAATGAPPPAPPEPPRDDPPPPPAEVPVLDRPDEHFEPPPPPPLPVPAPASLYALLLIAAGAVCIIAPGAVGLSLDVGIVIGVLAVVGGVAVLVSRMRDRPDDGDDGAVV